MRFDKDVLIKRWPALGLSALVIFLALAGIGLIFLIPPDSLDTTLVYKGF